MRRILHIAVLLLLCGGVLHAQDTRQQESRKARLEKEKEKLEKARQKEQEKKEAEKKRKAERRKNKIESQLISTGGRLLRRGLLSILK